MMWPRRGGSGGRHPVAGRLDADPRRVVVGWTGANPDADPSDPCWVGYAPEVSAEPDRVVVTIRTYRSRVPSAPSSPAPDLGFIRTLAVPLHNQLAVAATFPTAPSGQAVAAV
jgi:hypothetical protein